jgi:hypothetical protein
MAIHNIQVNIICNSAGKGFKILASVGERVASCDDNHEKVPTEGWDKWELMHMQNKNILVPNIFSVSPTVNNLNLLPVVVHVE